MNLDGHQLYIISNDWLFDLTTFTGYRTTKNSEGKLSSITKAYSVSKQDSSNNFTFCKDIKDIPMGVLRKTLNIINTHYKNTFIDQGVIDESY